MDWHSSVSVSHINITWLLNAHFAQEWTGVDRSGCSGGRMELQNCLQVVYEFLLVDVVAQALWLGGRQSCEWSILKQRNC